MYNWNIDLTKLKKNPQKYEQFVLEQRINFGLNQQKLSRKALKKHWHNLEIDPLKKKYLQAIL